MTPSAEVMTLPLEGDCFLFDLLSLGEAGEDEEEALRLLTPLPLVNELMLSKICLVLLVDSRREGRFRRCYHPSNGVFFCFSPGFSLPFSHQYSQYMRTTTGSIDADGVVLNEFSTLFVE